MLHAFLDTQRTILIDRCRSKVARRPVPAATDAELEHGIPLFFEQLVKTLSIEQTSEPMRAREVSGASGGTTPALSEIGVTAARHGRELQQHGFTIDQVVHDYGDLCQAITELAFERGAAIEVDEFRTLNRCLDNAIADAVTEFASERERVIANQGVQEFAERLGRIAHEMRNLLSSATLALVAIKSGKVALAGATGAVLDRSLKGLRDLVDRSLADVRAAAAVPAPHRLMSLADFIAEVQDSVSLQARVRDCSLRVCSVDPALAVDANPDMLFSAVGNLLQNAFKFTHRHTEVSLRAYAASDRILIDVEDHCGGLPAGAGERMFLPFTQIGSDRSGLGLGLSICRRSVEASNGILRVRDLPGAGCVFTIDLPRYAL